MSSYPDQKFIVFVFSPNCPHCQFFEPQWNDFMRTDVEKTVGYEFYKMDASEGENAEIIEKYDIMAFPGVLKIKGTRMVSKMEPGMADMPMMGYNW